jgi:hypothetical protein
LNEINSGRASLMRLDDAISVLTTLSCSKADITHKNQLEAFNKANNLIQILKKAAEANQVALYLNNMSK